MESSFLYPDIKKEKEKCIDFLRSFQLNGEAIYMNQLVI